MKTERIEKFGAIVQLGWPRALVFVDRARARSLGIEGGRLWDGAEPGVGDAPLAAPLEAHVQLTNRCDAGCKGCYTGASPEGAPNELGLEEWKRVIDELAAAGVFHLALGGGESATLPWLGEIARYARARGMIPNLTTSGLAGLERLLAITDLFGQINVSLDGLRDGYARVRGFDGFARADAALIALRKKKKEIGINVVVTRHSFRELDAIFAHARKRKLNEVELLRFKPSGRGAGAFAAMTCTDAQHRLFLPTVLAKLAVYGCTGGDFLVGVKPGGAITACSFASPAPGRPSGTRLREYWETPGAFGAFRTWRDAQEPCASCAYHDLCRGGCKVVSAHVCGDASAPDPECPRVVDHVGKRIRLPVV